LKSSLSLSKNLKNSFWNILEVVLAPLLFFISIPIFIDILGENDFGLWMFITSIVVFMQSMNLGLPFSTYKHISTGIKEGNKDSISVTLNINISLTLLLVLVCVLICSMLNVGIVKFDWFIDNSKDKINLINGLYLGMGILAVKFLEQIFYNGFRAYEEFQYATIISVGVKLFTVIGNLVIAYLTGNILYILSYTFFLGMLGVFVSYFATKKLTKFYRFKFTLERMAVKREIKYAFVTWLQAITIIFIFQGDKILVTSKFGMVALSSYVTIAMLFNHMHMAFGALTPWLFPQVAKNQEKAEEVKGLYISVRNSSIIMSTVILACFCLISGPLISFWLGEEMYSGITETVKWFCVFEFFFLLSITPNFYLNASGMEKFNLRMVLIYTGCNAIGLVLAYVLGTEVWHFVLALALSTILGMLLFHYFLNKKIARYKMGNVIVVMLPAVIGSGIALANTWTLKIAFFILCILSLYLIFFKVYKTNLKKIFGD